jgi:peptidoglycan-associated lipoprotein
MRRIPFLIACLVIASSAHAQLRLPYIAQRQPAAPVLTGIEALRADFLAHTGSDTVYFAGDSAILMPQYRTILAAEALWLRQHPEVVVRIEGHANTDDTRDHALAVGAGRASAVRDFLVLLGVPPAQLTAVSWGKERPGGAGNARAVTVLAR